MKQDKLGYIDLARCVAIMLVILRHQTDALAKVGDPGALVSLIGEYGQMGVQLFFIASALTLCRSSENRRSEPMPVRSFYLRRFFRIAPLYYCAIVLYGAIQWFTHHQVGDYTAGNVLANLFFVHGFDEDAINGVVPGGWSIAGEMMFYAIFPFAFRLAQEINRRWGVIPLVAIGLIGFCLYVAMWIVLPELTPYKIGRTNIFYYWPPAHAVVFWFGITGYFIFRAHRTPLWLDLIGLVVPTAISLALWRSDYVAAFAIIPGCSAVSFLFLVNLLARLKERQTVFHAIGRASFSIYVLHFLPVWFVAPVLIRLGGANIPTLVGSYLVTLAIAFGLAQLTKVLIEDRGIAFGKRLIARLQGGQSRTAPVTPVA